MFLLVVRKRMPVIFSPSLALMVMLVTMEKNHHFFRFAVFHFSIVIDNDKLFILQRQFAQLAVIQTKFRKKQFARCQHIGWQDYCREKCHAK